MFPANVKQMQRAFGKRFAFNITGIFKTFTANYIH